MTTTIKEIEGNLVAIFEGRLDTAAAPQCEKDLQPLNDCQGHDVILDCTSLSYISSSGLRLFLSVLKKAKPLGSHVYIKGMNADLRNVFTMTGFINLFEFKD
jgi:anti-sigma B factor antagonist